MKLFKSVDEKLLDLGFKKIEENQYGVEYERENKNFQYIQCLHLKHKKDGNHICQSFEKKINSDGYNNVVALTSKELKLVYKKMKQLGLA